MSFKEGIQVDQTWPSSLIVRESLILGSSEKKKKKKKKKLFVWSTGLPGYTYVYIHIHMYIYIYPGFESRNYTIKKGVLKVAARLFRPSVFDEKNSPI